MDAFTGMISMFGFNFAPLNWGMCSGQSLSIGQFSALYALLGNHFGGDGRVTFDLPDFRARGPIGSTATMGTSPTVPGTYYNWGEIGGITDRVLTVDQMPRHSHTATFTPTGGGSGSSVDVTIDVSTVDGDTNTPSNGNLLSKAPDVSFTPIKSFQTNTSVAKAQLGGVNVSGGGGGITGGSVSIGDAGNSQPFNMMTPYQAITFCMMLDGIFPARN